VDHKQTYLIVLTSLKTNWITKIYQKLSHNIIKSMCVY